MSNLVKIFKKTQYMFVFLNITNLGTNKLYYEVIVITKEL